MFLWVRIRHFILKYLIYEFLATKHLSRTFRRKYRGLWPLFGSDILFLSRPVTFVRQWHLISMWEDVGCGEAKSYVERFRLPNGTDPKWMQNRQLDERNGIDSTNRRFLSLRPFPLCVGYRASISSSTFMCACLVFTGLLLSPITNLMIKWGRGTVFFTATYD